MSPGQGRRTALRPRLTPADRQLLTLTQRVRSATCTPKLRERARMVLLLADGATITAIATQMRLARKAVYKWVRRWQEHGLKGLQDRKCGSPAARLRRRPRTDRKEAHS